MSDDKIRINQEDRNWNERLQGFEHLWKHQAESLKMFTSMLKPSGGSNIQDPRVMGCVITMAIMNLTDEARETNVILRELASRTTQKHKGVSLADKIKEALAEPKTMDELVAALKDHPKNSIRQTLYHLIKSVTVEKKKESGELTRYALRIQIKQEN